MASTPITRQAYRNTKVKSQEVSNFGDKHEVTYYEVINLERTAATLPYDNGYSTEEEYIWLDTSTGRRWHEHHTIDYYGGSSFVDLDGSSLVLFSKPTGFARDETGKAITRNTPDGAPLGEIAGENLEASELAQYQRLKAKFG